MCAEISLFFSIQALGQVSRHGEHIRHLLAGGGRRVELGKRGASCFLSSIKCRKENLLLRAIH